MPSLSELYQVPLNVWNKNLLDSAAVANGGDTSWRSRKLAEARMLLALSQIAPTGRLIILAIDLCESLRVLIQMMVPVARRPDPSNNLPMADHAVLGLTYPKEAVLRPLPGTSYFHLLDPPDAWHANVSRLGRFPTQILCLGTSLPANVTCTELVLMAYGALSMQTVQVDEGDPAGVLHIEAARWWQQNLHRMPLSTTPFLRPDPATPAKGIGHDRH